MFFRGNHQEEERRQQQNEGRKNIGVKWISWFRFSYFFIDRQGPMAKKKYWKKWLLVSFQNWKQWWEIIFFFSGLSFYSPFFSHWMLRDRYAAAPVWLCVYISKKDTKEKRRSDDGKKIGRSCLSFRDTAKEKSFVWCGIFWNENHPIFFLFRLLCLYSTGRLLRWNSLFFLAICLCIRETKCLSKREKANQIGNHCTQTHKREKENKFFTSFVGWYGAWRQRPHLYADWVRLASDTNQLLLLLFLRRPIFNAIRLIAVVVESDFCGYPQLQSKGSHLRHTDTHHIPIYGSDLTRRYTHGRNNKIQRKELLAVVYNSWYPSRKARRSQYALDFNFWN